MKRSILSTILLCALSGSAFALDWALNVNEVPLVIFGQDTLYIEVIKLRPVVTLPAFGASLKVEGETSYSTSSKNITDWSAGSLSFDLTEASLRGVAPIDGGTGGVAEWDLGRRSISDLTGGWIISSRWDGVSTSWQLGHTKWSGSTGYSGLLQKKTAKVSGSPADDADLNDSNIQFGPQRIYALTGASFVEAFWRQDLQLEVVGSYDLRQTGAVHGAYGTLAMTGPLPLGRQKTFGTAALRVDGAAYDWAYIGGIEWSATLPFLGSRLVISAVGAKGIGTQGFQPISGKGLAEVVTLKTTAGASAGADFSFKPVTKTTLGVKGSALFRTDLVNPGFTTFDLSSSSYWIGAEAGFYGSWTPTSDLNMAVSSGIFVPNSGAFKSDTKPTVMAVVTSTLKL